MTKIFFMKLPELKNLHLFYLSGYEQKKEKFITASFKSFFDNTAFIKTKKPFDTLITNYLHPT